VRTALSIIKADVVERNGSPRSLTVSARFRVDVMTVRGAPNGVSKIHPRILADNKRK